MKCKHEVYVKTTGLFVLKHWVACALCGRKDGPFSHEKAVFLTAAWIAGHKED